MASSTRAPERRAAAKDAVLDAMDLKPPPLMGAMSRRYNDQRPPRQRRQWKTALPDVEPLLNLQGLYVTLAHTILLHHPRLIMLPSVAQVRAVCHRW